MTITMVAVLVIGECFAELVNTPFRARRRRAGGIDGRTWAARDP
jgi:peptidoglycan/LPS O-acetylase OafA/YrhL